MGYTERPAHARNWNRFRHRLTVPAVAFAATFSVSTVATATSAGAQGSPIAAIVSEIAQREADISSINLEVGALTESVNQALVDLHDAQSLAEQARRGAAEAHGRLVSSQADVDRAQKELDAISHSSYRAAGSTTPVRLADGDQRKDSLDRQSYLRKEALDKQRTLEALQRTRTEAANEESTLRQVSRLADAREETAASAEAATRTLLEQSLIALDDQILKRDAALSALTDAQTQLERHRPTSLPVEAPEAVAPETVAPETVAEGQPASEPEPTPVTTESSELDAAGDSTRGDGARGDGATGDQDVADGASTSGDAFSLNDLQGHGDFTSAVAAIAEAVGATQPEHTAFSDPYKDSDDAPVAAPAHTEDADADVATRDEETGSNVIEVLPVVHNQEKTTEDIRQDISADSDAARQEQIEAVIARAESQIGAPYVWGGGDANGPTSGVPDGASAHTGQKGYDCSGLVLYAYSGAGVSLPHYTGYQYQRGTQIPVEQAERGDLLFWGPGGNQHVAIYLGDGMMLEAPQTGSNVQKAPVRQNGLAPYAVRLI